MKEEVRDKHQTLGPEVHRAGYMGDKRPEIDSGQPRPSAQRVVAGVPAGSTRYSIFPKPTQQQTLPDTDAQLFSTPSELGKGPESVAADMSTLSSTSTVTGTPASVQELLPHRQQFQQAGIVVTAVDQKSTKRSRKFFQLHARGPSDRCSGGNPPTQETTSRKEFDINAVVHRPNHDPLAQTAAMDLPQGDRKQDLGGRLMRWAVSRVAEKPSKSPEAPTEPAQPLTSERNATKLRPSAMFWITKPLPALPQSPQPPASAEAGQEASLFRSKIEKVPLDERLQDLRRRPRPSFSLPATSMGKREKTMATLRMVLTSPRARHAVAIPAREASVATLRPRPPAIIEDEQSSPEKPKMRGHMQRVQRNDTHLESESQRRQSCSRKAISTAETGVPEIWTHITSANSLSETSPNDVVPRPETTENRHPQTRPGKTNLRGRRGTSKLSSPSQRLRRAVVMRRQRIAEAAEPEPEAGGQPVVPGTMSTAKAALSSSTSSQALSEPDDDISDRDVLRGLKIICAASADAEFDAFVWSKTGLRLRRFLANLQSFEELGEVTMGGKTAISKADESKEH